jgi:SWI/SNF-related matrix-associated actin-dependent regulator 1 of chromatin subfamily A
MPHQISITREGDRYVARFPFSYETKDVVKAAGFQFDGVQKVWFTTDPGVAAKFDPEAGAALVASSRATDAQIDIPAPAGLNYLPYQRAGIAYAQARRDTLIGDEMGLGKTVETIGLINAEPSIERVLVICPASLKINWRRELERWLVRPMSIGIANGGAFPDADVVILNYDILAKHRAAINAVQWDLAVLDECHFLKNPKAQRTRLVLGHWDRDEAKRIRPIGARRRLFLTGTPIVNRPVELWPLIQATNPSGLGRIGFMRYAARFCDAKKTHFGWDFSGASNLDELQRILRESVMVRRLKADVLTELPAKRRQIMVMPVTDPDIRDTLRAELEAYDAYEDAGLKERTAAFNKLSDLRHRTALAKVPTALEHIRGMLEETDKLVVFAHHHDVIETLRVGLQEYGAVSLTGEDSGRARQEAVDRFQGNPGTRVFIGSIQAAGLGLTLTAAQTVVFVELDWVPGNMTQAEDRLHRIGQTGSVLVQHLVLNDSLDARMRTILVEKQTVLDAALDNPAEIPAEVPAAIPTAPAAIPAAVPELSPEQVEAVHQGLRLLAGVCDGAVERDGCGFNARDTAFGHSLAMAPWLSQKQAQAGRRMIILYQRQLPDALVAAVRGFHVKQ